MRLHFSKMPTILIALSLLLLFSGCATTEYKSYEGKNNVLEGSGGTKAIVDGMEIWDNGEPPRKFKVMGIIEDERPGGLIPMSQLHSDMVKKAREVGGDAIIQLQSESQIKAYHNTGSATAYSYDNSAIAHGSSITVPIRKNTSKFAVIKYLD